MAQTNTVVIRGIYGGVPAEWFARGQSLHDYGVNAVWIGSGRLTADDVASLHSHGAKVFAEFNTMHEAGYLKDNPDAAPMGPDGQISLPPDGWQGVCPTHPGYRNARMEAFRTVLCDFAVDGIWLDYHHSHASWERAEPNLPDTCFCARCLAQFSAQTGITPSAETVPQISAQLLGKYRDSWIDWRCSVFTDWVREMREIIDTTRPTALLGTFHCPWSEGHLDGALRSKLAIDLKAQLQYIDVFSTMPYHARFGHNSDLEWISQQVAWLGHHLGVSGEPGERTRIWPIVQLSDWGEKVAVEDVAAVLSHGTRSPATGITVFAWESLRQQPDKLEAMGRFYRALHAQEAGFDADVMI